MTTTADHLRNTLDGRWRDVKTQMRHRLTDEIFRPHYTPNTVIARTKVAEQVSIMASATSKTGTATSARRSRCSRCSRCPICP